MFLLSILILLTFLSFLPVLHADFIWYDDDVMLFNNPIFKGINFESLKQVFSFQNIVHYHPFVYLSYAIESSVFSLNPFYFHLTNLILHCINVILVYNLIIRIKNNKSMAFIIAALFAVHPLHVESVAWITERKDLLYSLFYISSLILYIKYKKNHSAVFYSCSLALFVFSCLSKSMAITLPMLLLLIDFMSSKTVKFNIKEKIPFILITLIFTVINLNVAYYKTDIEVYGLFERVSLICYALLFYPFKMFLPIQLSVIYPYPAELNMLYLVSPFIILALTVTLLKIKTPKYIRFGLLFYIITILPVLPVLPFGISLTADRFSYIPLLGLFFIIAQMLYNIQEQHYENRNLRNGISAGLICIILLFSYGTFSRSNSWRNTEILINDAIKKESNNYYAYYILGNYYSSKKDHSLAINSYISCIQIKNDYSDAYYNLGNEYYESGNIEEAIKYFLKTIEINPADKLAHNNLGVAYEMSGNREKAIEHYRISANLGFEPARNVLKHYGFLK